MLADSFSKVRGWTTWALALALGVALVGDNAWAQTSSLRGTVTDPQGSAIPAAVVTLTAAGTSAGRKAVSGENGEYQFLQVPPGAYSLRIEKPGFAVTQKEGLTLQVNTPATLDVKLELGNVGQTVNVSADTTSINTVDATVGNPFTQRQVRELPLQTRNVVELLSLQPGVTASGEVLGARRDQNNITLDGVDANDNQTSGIRNAGTNGSNANGGDNRDAGFNAALPVPLDSVQEFRVTVAGQGAQFGRSSGGQVSLITKSGTNEFHGSLYEFHRNTLTAANSWFNNRAGIPREKLIRNQFGASLGGRIIKDRVFFFVNGEGRRDASAQSALRQVPSANLRNGILTVADNRGGVQTLSPSEVQTLDPLRQGFSPAMRQFLSQYPQGNDPSAGTDRGLNFVGYRFNAPFAVKDNYYVSKMDFNLDGQNRHAVYVRGTLADMSQDLIVAQFAGQDPASKLLNNSRGIAASYTAVLKPNLVNVFTYGLTRLGLQQSGTLGTALAFDGLSSLQNFAGAARPFVRINPTHNFANDITWTKGAHTISGGINFRFTRNARNSYVNSFPSYSFSRNTLNGLGNDAIGILNGYLGQRNGVALASTQNAVRGFGALLGLLNQMDGTYNFEPGKGALPFGQPVARRFAANEYDFYAQDSWRARRDLTLTFGVRYSYMTPPWETNGIQVGTTTGADVYFAERVGASQQGIPGFRMPNAALTYALNGPVNGKPSWFQPDRNNFAPRFGFAYNPNYDGLLGKLFGKGSVLRGGFSMVYDRYGNDLITSFDQTGSPGLASAVTQPANTNFTTSPRYNGGASFPALPAAQAVSFPFTPATIVGGFGSAVGIQPDLVAPYSLLMNMTYTRELPGKLTIETGYVGRLMRKNLLQRDIFQPLTEFKDPRSGQTWSQAVGQLRSLVDRGVTPAQVQANPSLVGTIPYFENMFPGVANYFIPGNATANYFWNTYGMNDGSELDGLNNMDRRISGGPATCFSVGGCNTFFALQNAGLRAWTNAGMGSFHGGTITVRRALANGFTFDFNYTLAHAIDNSSAAESGAGNGGAVIQNSFDLGAFRGSSDFDIRHNITANGLVELPFGRGRRFLGSAKGLVNQIVGGWNIGTLMRYRSGLPSTISNSGYYATNYLTSSLAIPKPGTTTVSGPGFDQTGAPSVFRNTNAVNNFVGQYPGRVGTRAALRLDDLVNFDIAVMKNFTLPFERHRLQLRAEAFNAFNHVNFTAPVLRLDQPSIFGQFQSATAPRVMQFALRYEF